MANELSNERSLYLRQHAGNPVNWKPWGKAALREATERDVPLLVSIGYSSCHWCHVMEHECFEDAYIAGLMNTHFVCVKVDREERPDVDSVFMEAVQMIQGHGGWPLNVFCLPDGRPFFGGTYFPPEDNGNGMIPWPQLLMRIADYYKRRRAELEENAGNILANLEAISEARPDGDAPGWSNGLLIDAVRVLVQSFDTENGGFGEAPKFPPSMALEFLTTVRVARAVDGDRHLAPAVEQAVEFTLETMVRSGLYDQVGGGFFRYCVDATWTIPHFEKMLYDNGLLLSALARGAVGRDDLERLRVASAGTIAWLDREMRGSEPDGSGRFDGFAAALDADSPGGEGRFYCWTREEVVAVAAEAGVELPEGWDAALGFGTGGNFEHGWTHLSYRTGDGETWRGLEPLRECLRRSRERRGRPGLDPKRIAAWNGLVARGMADAAYVFGEVGWYRMARETIDWVEQFFEGEGGLLRSVGYPDGVVRSEVYLDDQVFVVEALLAVARAAARFEPEAVNGLHDRAGRRMRAALEAFDDGKIGLTSVPTADDPVLIRKRDWYDNAIPSGNSSALTGRIALAAINPEGAWTGGIGPIRDIYAAWAGRMPNGVGHALAGLAAEAVGVVVVKGRTGDDLAAVAGRFARGVST